MNTKKLSVSVENRAPQSGTNLTPVWVGFHDGGFDTYDRNAPSTTGLERLAEDGNNAVISQEFANSGFGNVDGTLGGAPIAPGATVRGQFMVDASQGRYFNYASMILPSNDTFIANGNPLLREIFDEHGNFIGAEFTVSGAEALDAGTEVNDEIPANTAFFGQAMPNTGVDENGTVQLATGFNPVGEGGILDDPRFANADYTAPGYQVARIRVANLVEGTAKRDRLVGTSARDDIFGGEGNNVLRGRGGDDRIYAGAGNDRIFAGSGNDVVNAGGGNNRIWGGSGNDIINAGGGNDRIWGGSGDDIINAGDGNNRVFGGNGNDRITTGRGRDLLVGGRGNDVLSSGAGNDVLRGNGGNDVFDAGTGRDQVFAGRGHDTFVLNAGEGLVDIFNYGVGDSIALGEGLSSDAITTHVRGRNTIISSGSDVLARLRGVQTSASELHFVA